MTREQAIKELTELLPEEFLSEYTEAIKMGIEALSNAENPNKWISVKWHTITDEERESEGYPKEWVNHVDCVMPEDGQEILITVKGRKGNRWVEKDTNYIDDGFYLDSGYDWVEDVVAWMELPEPYQSEIPTVAEGSDKE